MRSENTEQTGVKYREVVETLRREILGGKFAAKNDFKAAAKWQE